MKRKRGEGCLYRRGPIWWIKYAAGGRTHRESARSTSARDAAALLRRRLAEVTMGQHAPDAGRITLADLTRGVEDNYRANGRRSLRRVQQATRHLRDYFGNPRASDITAYRIEAYVSERRNGGAALATVANEIAALRRGFSLAVRSGRLGSKPAFPTLQLNNARTGFFEEEEFRSLVAELPRDLRAPITFAYLTGWRLASEVLPLRWSQVADGVVRLEASATKNREGREWPVHVLPELQRLLETQREATRELERELGAAVPYVFHRRGQRIKSIRSAWEGACRRAGLAGRIPHDFRRTAVRSLERAGVPRSVAMKLVGHRTESVYRRYAIVASRDLADGVARLAQLRESMGGNARLAGFESRAESQSLGAMTVGG